MKRIKYLIILAFFAITACKQNKNITPDTTEDETISDINQQIREELSENLRTASTTTGYRVLQASSLGAGTTRITLPSNKSIFFVIDKLNSDGYGCYSLIFSTIFNNDIRSGCLLQNDDRVKGTFTTGSNYSSRTVNFDIRSVTPGKKWIFAWGYN